MRGRSSASRWLFVRAGPLRSHRQMVISRPGFNAISDVWDDKQQRYIHRENWEHTHEGSRLEKTVCLVGKFLFLCPSLVIICFKNWTRIYIYSKNIFIYMLHIFKDVVVECYRSATKSVHSAAIWQLYGSIRYRITRLQSSFVPLRLRDSWTVEDLIKRKKTLTREHRDAPLENRRRRHTTTQVTLKLR